MGRRLLEVIKVLNKGTTVRLMRKHGVDTLPKLANRYDKGEGLRALVGSLYKKELCKALTVLDRTELQEVVYGALAFDSKADHLIRNDDEGQKEQGNLRELKGIMDDLCGWSVDRFKQPTYNDLIEMLNRFGVDVEERELDRLEKKRGKRASGRKVRLQRMFRRQRRI